MAGGRKLAANALLRMKKCAHGSCSRSEHRELLAYLVRRLLEKRCELVICETQLANHTVAAENDCYRPFREALETDSKSSHTKIMKPADLYQPIASIRVLGIWPIAMT